MTVKNINNYRAAIACYDCCKNYISSEQISSPETQILFKLAYEASRREALSALEKCPSLEQHDKDKLAQMCFGCPKIEPKIYGVLINENKYPQDDRK